MNQNDVLKPDDQEQFASNEHGATAIEYGLIGALVAVVIIGALMALGEGLFMTFTETACTVRGFDDCATCLTTLASETGSPMFDPAFCPPGSGPGGSAPGSGGSGS